jgi:hypothetical protein
MRAVFAFAFAVVMSFIATAASASNATMATRCSLGHVVAERPLLLPRTGTFYSVDALNPDIVRKGRVYYLFFSGNSEHSPGGVWRTGVAIARSPLGPFRVLPTFQGRFLNGGTTVWHGRFWQATLSYDYGNVLITSRDARRWRRVASIPAPAGWPVAADFYLQARPDRLRVFMLVRRSPTIPAGGTIAVMDWIRASGRWTRFRTLLAPGVLPWDNLDLGEPALAALPGRALLLYTATAAGTATRTIGIARRLRTGAWQRCARKPLIGSGAPWGTAVSIDPSVLVEGNMTYVYFGAGSGTSIAADLGGGIGVRVYRRANDRL